MMKKTFACSLILAAAFAVPAMAATTVTGVITDDMCGKKHMMPGKSDADCIRACVKDGAKFAVQASDGKTYMLAGKTSDLNALAGKKATVSGDLKGNTLTVSSVAAAR